MDISNRNSFFEHLGEASLAICRELRLLVVYAYLISASLFKSLLKPRKIRWREVIYYMDMCGTDALPIVSLLCLLMGLIMAYQSAFYLHKYGADIELTVLMGVGVCKELAALMVAIISTGRAGSAFAAEIGTMKINDEINALSTMGLSPLRFLVVPKMLAMIFVSPILTVYGMFAALTGGLIIGTVYLEISVQNYLQVTIDYLRPVWVYEGMLKGLVYGILIAAVGCVKGLESQNDAKGVGKSTTSAVVASIFWIVLSNALITYLFMKWTGK